MKRSATRPRSGMGSGRTRYRSSIGAAGGENFYGDTSGATCAVHMGAEPIQPVGRSETRAKFAKRMAKYIAAAPANGFTVDQLTQGQMYPASEVHQYLND